MRANALTRRAFAGTLLGAPVALAQSQLGSLYPTVQALADSSPLQLSYLRPEFKDLSRWQRIARERLMTLLHYNPPRVQPQAEVLAKTERDGYTEERIMFRTTPQSRVPAHVLVPSKRARRAPGVVVLHDHGGFYMWGREKVVATAPEHPVLTEFKKTYYGGRSVANELVRQGYVVIAIDMFYWGERRYLMPNDPPAWKDRPLTMTEREINEFNARSGANEQFIARGLLTAGVTWPGVMLWDDIRTLDYLASRPEVDPQRLGCVGLSVGGYRSFLLAALDTRIKAAVDVGWMTTYARQIERHVIHTMGLTFVIPGMYEYLDLPDLAALIAPRPVMVMMGSRDGLFPTSAIQAAFAKIGECYKKAGAPDRQRCRMFDVPHQFNAEMQAEAWQWLQPLLNSERKSS